MFHATDFPRMIQALLRDGYLPFPGRQGDYALDGERRFCLFLPDGFMAGWNQIVEAMREVAYYAQDSPPAAGRLGDILPFRRTHITLSEVFSSLV